MKIIGVIPARYASTRFPGKPLADIMGKPMIWWVYQQVMKVRELDEVYIATEDQRIHKVAETLGCNVVMTSDKHLTGTDRVAEVAEKIDADWYVNIQGDEPMVEPDIIRALLSPVINNEESQIINLMVKITDPIDVVNPTVVKVVANENSHILYLTRSMAPFPKGSIEYDYYKHLGIFAFTHSALDFFMNTPRGRIESIEDIEMLRFIEHGYMIKCIEVEGNSVAVDTEKDLEKVRDLFSARNI